MIRDLTDISVKMVTEEEKNNVISKAKDLAEERILDILIPRSKDNEFESQNETREKMRTMLREGKLDDRSIEIEVTSKNFPLQIFSQSGIEEMDVSISDMLGNLMPKKSKKKKVKVPDAMEVLIQEEAQKLVDMDKVVKLAVERVEQTGIVFVDEIDKICGRESTSGPDVSREGVQRDLLPIIEGCTVNTKHGLVKTDHILFVGAGAFHVSKPSDLIPELQGRFPIRVELDALSKDDFIRILTEPKNALIKQYKELLKTEDISLDFTEDAIVRLAEIAEEVNESTENIGARRLHTILEKILEEISFDAPDITETEFKVDSEYIKNKISDIVKDRDLSRYIL